MDLTARQGLAREAGEYAAQRPGDPAARGPPLEGWLRTVGFTWCRLAF